MNTKKYFAVISVSCVLIAVAIKPAASFKLMNFTRVGGNACVKGYRPLKLPHTNEAIMEVECHTMSFACLSSISKEGFPKCGPVYTTRTILQTDTFGNKSGAITMRIPINCVCVA